VGNRHRPREFDGINTANSFDDVEVAVGRKDTAESGVEHGGGVDGVADLDGGVPLQQGSGEVHVPQPDRQDNLAEAAGKSVM
jgi:hypothetical protein